jgi:hypothetical protein
MSEISSRSNSILRVWHNEQDSGLRSVKSCRRRAACRQSDVEHRLFKLAELLPAGSRWLFLSRFATCEACGVFAQAHRDLTCRCNDSVRLIDRKSRSIFIPCVGRVGAFSLPFWLAPRVCEFEKRARQSEHHAVSFDVPCQRSSLARRWNNRCRSRYTRVSSWRSALRNMVYTSRKTLSRLFSSTDPRVSSRLAIRFEDAPRDKISSLRLDIVARFSR